jgi:effector-binding domain-containing protein
MRLHQWRNVHVAASFAFHKARHMLCRSQHDQTPGARATRTRYARFSQEFMMTRPRLLMRGLLMRTLAAAALGATLGLFHPLGAMAEDKPAATTTPDAGKPADPFGEEVTLPSKSIIYFKGNGTWDSAFETITDAFKTVNEFLSKAGIKPDGQLMTIYTSTDDSGFQFQAAVPISEVPKDPPKGDLTVGKSPGGRAYKFVHRGSYDSMDTTYEAITNFLDEKGIDAKESFIEEYVTDPLTTSEDKLIVYIYVPIK